MRRAARAGDTVIGEDALPTIGRRLRGTLWALALCLLAGGPVSAQGTPGGASPAAKPMTAGGTAPKPAGPPATEIRETKPEVFYVRDASGMLVPVPDFQYDDFKRLYDLEQKLAQEQAPPSYVLQSLQATGAVRDDVAELEARLKWVVRSQAWVRIPLRFGTGVLREPPTYDGPGEHFLEPDRGGGLAIWVRERDPAPHVLTLRLRVPIKRAGDEQQLNLPCPAAPLSELTLTVAAARVAASASGGTLLGTEAGAAAGTTVLRAAGLGDAFQLAWRPRETNGPRQLGAAESTTAITVRVEGARRLTSVARIKVRGVGAGVDSLRVKLPVGMEFSPAAEPGFSTSVVETLPATAGGRATQVVEVRPEVRGASTWDFTLRATTAEGVGGTGDAWLETLGYEIPGLVRQSGAAEFVIDGEWALQYGERGIAQPAELSEAARQQGVVARFEFARQPASLLVQVQPRKSRTTVEPTYVMNVGASQARLQASLNYRFGGAAATRLQVDCGAWIVDRVEPERYAMYAATRPEEPGLLTITWPPDAGPPSKDFELQIFAHLDVAPDQPLTLPIPRPVTDGASTATIVVAPEDNVALAPRVAELAGLVAEPLPPTGAPQGRQQPPLFYRARLDAEPRKFVADVRPRPRAMSVDMRHELRVADGEIRAEHRLQYVVVNESASRFQVTMGRADGAAPRVRFFFDGGTPPLVPLAAREADPGDEVPGRQWELQLPEARLGEFAIVARTAWPAEDDGTPRAREFTVPLVVPVSADDTTVVRNRLYLSADERWRVELTRHEWRAVDESFEDDADRHAFADETCYVGPDSAASAVVRRGRAGAGPGAVRVRRAWVQTWLGRDLRHDRAVWRLVAPDGRAEFQLPEGVAPDEVQGAVDGAETTVEVADSRRAVVSVPSDGKEHVIELSLLSPRPASVQGGVTLELPRLLRAVGAPRFFWQLIVSGNEHLWLPPSSLGSESTWGWRRGVFERQGAWSQAELERWSGASEQEAPPEETNRYLFSSIGAPEYVEFRLASRALLVTIASAALLFVGLSLLYFPALRHPVWLAAGGCVLVGVALVQPDLAATGAQAALLGWALVLLARVLRGAAARRPAPVLVRASRSGVAAVGAGAGGAVEPRGERSIPGEIPPPATTAAAELPLASPATKP